MPWWPREEVSLLLAGLVACGCLVLGVLDLLWPARPAAARRRSAAPRLAAVAVSPPSPFRPRLESALLLLDEALAEADPGRRVAALGEALVALEREARRAPDDGALQSALWAGYQQLALARIASDTALARDRALRAARLTADAARPSSER